MSANLDVVRALDRRLGPHEGSWPEMQWACPFCLERRGRESAKKKLRVNMAKGYATCYSCGYGSRSLWSLFRGVFGAITPELKDVLSGVDRYVDRSSDSVWADVVSRIYADHVVSSKTLEPQPLPAEALPIWGGDKPCGRARDYVAYRGVSEAVGRLYDLRYCYSGRYAGHIVFPVYMGGTQVFWTTRVATREDVKIKSQNPANVDGFHSKKTVLLNYDNAVGQPVVFLTEGPFSCASFRRRGIASLGRKLSDAQVSLISALVPFGLKELVVAYDDDAWSEADEAAQMLGGRVPLVTIARFDYGDPNSRRRELSSIVSRRGPYNALASARQRLLS